MTALISSVGASKNAKRAALIHLYFNIIGTVLFMVVFYAVNAVFPFAFMDSAANAAGIAVIHTTFNIIATAVLLPFSGTLEKLTTRWSVSTTSSFLTSASSPTRRLRWSSARSSPTAWPS